MNKSSLIVSSAIAVMLLLPHVVTAEVIVLSSGASRSAISELGQIFERSTNHKLAIRFANNPILKRQIDEGALFDVVIIEPDMISDLAKRGKVSVHSRADLVRVGMALGARSGTPRPDISTVKGFADFLRNSDSVAYTADGHSGKVFIRTLEHLGLIEVMQPRLKPAIGRTASSLVESGEAQLWAGPITTPRPGTQILGRFPDEIQTYVGISAAISSGPKSPELAQLFMNFLVSSEARTIFEAKGYQLLPAR